MADLILYTMLWFIIGWAFGLAAMILGYLIGHWETIEDRVSSIKKDKPKTKKATEKTEETEKQISARETAAAKKSQTQLFPPKEK